MVYPYNITLFSIKKEWTIDPTTRMNPKIIMSKRTQKKNTYCFIPFIQNPRKCKLIYSARKQISSCLEGLRGLQRHKETFGCDQHVHYLDVYMCMCVTSGKTHQMILLKYVQFVCQLHLNKVAKIETKILKMVLPRYIVFEDINWNNT